jgi:small-conductance mechanosensitive channel
MADVLWASAPRLAWTLVLIGGAYLVGVILNAWVVSRLSKLAAFTAGHWDDIVIAELRKRIPWWSLLVGTWLSLGRWPLSPRVAMLSGRALFVLGALSVTFAVSAIATKFVANYSRTAPSPLPVTGLTNSLVTMLVVGLGLLVILNGLGVSVTPILTALGVGGLAVALALQEPLSNLFAGIFITLSGQLRVGDYVKLQGDLEGYIADFGWRSTRVRQLANNLIVVPNAKLSQALVINYHLPGQDLAVLVECGVDYGSDLEKVERVTIEVGKEVMREVQGGVPDFEPFIRFHTFGESSINFTTILRGQEYVDQYLVKHEFVKRLQRRFKKEGITIPFPIRTLIHHNAPGAPS